MTPDELESTADLYTEKHGTYMDNDALIQLTWALDDLQHFPEDRNAASNALNAMQRCADLHTYTASHNDERRDSERFIEAALPLFTKLMNDHKQTLPLRSYQESLQASIEKTQALTHFSVQAVECIPTSSTDLSVTSQALRTPSDEFPDPRKLDIHKASSSELASDAEGLHRLADLLAPLSAHGYKRKASRARRIAKLLRTASVRRRNIETLDAHNLARSDLENLPAGRNWQPRDLNKYDTGLELTKTEFDKRIAETPFQNTAFIETGRGEYALTGRERGTIFNLLNDLASAYPSVARDVGSVNFAGVPRRAGLAGQTGYLLSHVTLPFSMHLDGNPHNWITIYTRNARQPDTEDRFMGSEFSDQGILVTLIHEFGHQLHDQAVLRTQTASDRGGGANSRDHHVWRGTVQGRSGINRSATDRQVADTSSGYATCNHLEAVAEAFVDCWTHGDQAASINKRLISYVNLDLTARDTT